MKLMDVTLRESVYYGSGIDYDEGLEYLQKLGEFVSNQEIEYVEICYVNTDKEGHLNYNENYIRAAYDICKDKYKLVGMMHPGAAEIRKWNPDVIKLFSMVRIVCSGKSIPDSVKEYVEYLHNLGVDVAINIAFALSKSFEEDEKLCEKCIEYGADYVYLADSSGSAMAQDISKLCDILKRTRKNNAIGLHLHDHLSLSFSNALIAYENDIDITDVSITGAGRGGGNLKTEFMVPHLKNVSGEVLYQELFDRLLQYIEYFNVLVRRDSSIYKQLFLDTLSGIYRLGLKQQEEIEKAANGNAHKYIQLVFEDIEG